MLSVRFFSILSLRLLFAFSFSLAMEESNESYTNINNKQTLLKSEDPKKDHDEHYNVFKAVQIIKKLFIEELNQMKDSIPAKFHENYEKYKETILNLTLEPKQFYFFQIQGLIVHFSNDLELLTCGGKLNFTTPLRWYQKSGTNISNQDIAKFLRNFENKLLNHGELSIEESSNSAITYKVHSVGEIVLPEPIITSENSNLTIPCHYQKLWQAMEKRYKEENDNKVIST